MLAIAFVTVAMVPRALLLLAVSAGVVGCVSDEERAAQQQHIEAVRNQNAVASAELRGCATKYPETTRENAVPFAECMVSPLNHFATKPSDITYAIAYKRLSLARSFADGQITFEQYLSQFTDYVAQMKTQTQMRENEARIAAASESAAKAANCMAAQQRQANTDYSGVDSRYGTVAVISLLGEISDAADTAAACN